MKLRRVVLSNLWIGTNFASNLLRLNLQNLSVVSIKLFNFSLFLIGLHWHDSALLTYVHTYIHTFMYLWIYNYIYRTEFLHLPFTWIYFCLYYLGTFFFVDKNIVYFYRYFQMLTKATADGTLTRDWDTEPLFPLPNADAVNKEYSLSLSLTCTSAAKFCLAACFSFCIFSFPWS